MGVRARAVALLTAALIPLAGHAAADEIHVAALTGDVAAIAALLDAGTPVDAPDPNGTPLIWALIGQQAQAARLLIENGADPNAQTPTGWPPLVYAIKMADGGLLEAMLARGADPDAGAVLTPLGAAVEDGHTVMVERLLAAGADPSVRMKEGWTALHKAAETGRTDIARLLLRAGAGVNALTDSGRPALHYAVQRGHDDLAEARRAAGAAPGPVDAVTAHLATADIAAGEAEAQVCARCHALTQDADDYFPERPLWNIVDHPVGALGDYEFTPALRAIGARWDYETLNRFLARPTEFAPGTKMDLVGIPDVGTRADIILYLRSLSDSTAPLP